MKKYHAGIGKRLIGAFLILLTFLALTTSFALWRLHAANDMAHHLVDDKLAKQQLAADWLAAVSRNGVRANAIARSDSLEVGDYFRAQLDDGELSIAAIRKKASSSINSAHETSLIAAVEQARANYIQARGQVFQYKETGRTMEVEKLLAAEMEPKLKKYEAALGALLAHQTEQADSIAAQSNQAYQASIWLLAGLGAVALAIGAALAWSLTNSLVKPLRNAIDLASNVADGDLSVDTHTDRTDEIGDLLRALDRMTRSLSGAVGGVREGVNFMEHSLKNMAADNAQLASKTSEQAASLEQIAASMEELTSTVQENADNAAHAAQLAHAASDVAGQGGDAVLQMVESMDSIHHSAQQINSIIGVIDEIAFQTNILALNAAVEAARAGEQGRGFAVVANEVRNLARRASGAAKEIKDLIQRSGAEISRGGTLAKKAGARMQDVVRSVAKVNGLIAEISVASKEQSNALAQISDAVVHMDGMTQHNAALVTDAAETTASLKAHSMGLVQAMSIFKLSGMHANAADMPIAMPERADREAAGAQLSYAPPSLKLVSPVH